MTVFSWTRIKYNSLLVSLLRLQIWDFLTMWLSKITKFFALPLSFKIVSFHNFGKASIICNQHVFWVSLRWNSIFISSHISILLWNLKFLPKCLPNSGIQKEWYYFPIMKIIFKQSFYPKTLYTCYPVSSVNIF